VELPKPEELTAALTAFPPKLSILVKPLSLPEEIFESSIKTTGVEIPPGPTKMLVSFMESFEAGAVLPGLPAPTGTPEVGEKTQVLGGKAEKIDVEVF